MGMNYRLSPSDLTYLYEGCKHCFVLKARHSIAQPSIPLPGMFGAIGGLQKNYYSGKRTEQFCPALPPGTVEYGEKNVRSLPIPIPGSGNTCYISGRFDIVVKFDDGTFGVVDFKTANPSDQKSEMYARQLHAYAQALEHPAPDALRLSPVAQLGLFYFTPDACRLLDPSRQILEGRMQWVPVERNDEEFLKFLAEVVGLLDGELPQPKVCASCPHCSAQRACEVGKDLDKRCRTCVCTCCHWCVYPMKRNEAGSVATAAAVTRSASPPCPTCGGPMVKRQGRRGEFWGCRSYPECRGSMDA